MRDEIQEQLRNEGEMRDDHEKPKYTKQIQTILRKRLREIKALHATSERNQNTQRNQRKQNEMSGGKRNQWQTSNKTENKNTKSNENQQRYDQQRYNQQRYNQQRYNKQEGQQHRNQGNKLWMDRSLMEDPHRNAHTVAA